MRGLGRFLTREALTVPAGPAAAHSGGFEGRSLAEFGQEYLDATGQSWFDRGPDYGYPMQIPGAWRAATLLSGLIGLLPQDAYRGDPRDGQADRVTPTPVLLANPSPGFTRFNVMQSWVLDYLWHGNAIGIVAARDAGTGWPTALAPVPARSVQVAYANGATYADGTSAGPILYRITGRSDQVYGWRDIFHVRGPSEPGATRGLGVLEQLCSTWKLARDQQRQASSIAVHGVPTGVLQAGDPDVTPAELASGKASWLNAQATRTIAALPPGVKFEAISWNPEELQLVEARKFSLQEIALSFGLPGRYLGVESGSLTYSTPALDSVDLLKLTVDPHLVAFEQETDRHLPVGTWTRFDREAVLATDTMTRFQAYALATGGQPWMLDSEVRREENLAPLPEVPTPSAEVEQALNLAKGAPSLVQNPGLPALVDQLRALNGKAPINPTPTPATPDNRQEGDAA